MMPVLIELPLSSEMEENTDMDWPDEIFLKNKIDYLNGSKSSFCVIRIGKNGVIATGCFR